MKRFLVIAVVFAVALAFSGTVSAQPSCPEEGIYELLPGSELRLECFACELIEPIIALAGRFRLESLPVGQAGESYRIYDIEFRHREGRTLYHRVTGEGSYTIGPAGTQTIALTLSLGGEPPQDLAGAAGVDPTVVWPSIDIEAAVDRPGEGIFINAARLVAAPVRPAEFFPYRLKPESYMLVDCDFCRRLVRPIPIEGSFLLGQTQDTPPLTLYRVECIDFRSVDAEVALAVVSGFGSFSRFEEFALTQTMTLDLSADVSGQLFEGAVLQSGSKPAGALFPEILIDLVQSNPVDSNTILKFHLVAEPGEFLPVLTFRRGDANDDGQVDLSDPVAILNWQFLGETEPSCRETADANDDGPIDLSDPVYLLSYLFLAGEEPPKPGAADCGHAPDPGAFCDQYDSCQ